MVEKRRLGMARSGGNDSIFSRRASKDSSGDWHSASTSFTVVDAMLGAVNDTRTDEELDHGQDGSGHLPTYAN